MLVHQRPFCKAHQLAFFHGTFFATDPSGNYLLTAGSLPQIERDTQNTKHNTYTIKL